MFQVQGDGSGVYQCRSADGGKFDFGIVNLRKVLAAFQELVCGQVVVEPGVGVADSLLDVFLGHVLPNDITAWTDRKGRIVGYV